MGLDRRPWSTAGPSKETGQRRRVQMGDLTLHISPTIFFCAETLLFSLSQRFGFSIRDMELILLLTGSLPGLSERMWASVGLFFLRPTP